MVPAIFYFGCKFYKQSGCKGQSQTASPIKHQTPHLAPENIREPALDFTVHFGEINPDILYLCRRGLSELKKAIFAFFPSVRRELMKKNVKSSIFRKKTSKFLSSLPLRRKSLIINEDMIMHRNLSTSEYHVLPRSGSCATSRIRLSVFFRLNHVGRSRPIAPRFSVRVVKSLKSG